MVEPIAYSVLIVGGAVTAVGMLIHYRVSKCPGGILAAMYAACNSAIGVVAWTHHIMGNRAPERLLYAILPLVVFTAYTAVAVFRMAWRASK